MQPGDTIEHSLSQAAECSTRSKLAKAAKPPSDPEHYACFLPPAQKLHKIAEDLVGEVVFVKLNGSCPSFHSLFEQLNITSVPWFLFIRDGKIVHGMSTSLNPERLAAFRRTLHDLRSAM